MIKLWFLLAILAALGHAIVSSLDKILMKNKKLKPLSLSTIRLGTNAIILLIISISFFSFKIPTGTSFWVYILSIAMVYTGAVVFYFSALKYGDVSKLIPYREMITILLSFILALSFLSEKVNIFDFIGVIFIIIGGYVILTDGKIVIPKKTKGILFMSIDAIFLAIYGIIAKSATFTIEPIWITLFMYIFIALFLALINFGVNFSDQVKTFQRLFENKKLLLVSFGASLSAALGTLSLITALSIGDAAKVLPISKILPLFVVLIGWFSLKEKHGIARLIGAIIICLGIYFMYT